MIGQKGKNIILLIITMTVIGYSYYTFYLSSVMADISEMQQTVATVESNVNELRAHSQTVDSEIEQAKQSNKKLDIAVPDVYDKKVLIMYFYNLIKEKGLDSDNISFSENDKGNSGYNTINISLRVSGVQESVKSFVKTIENDKRKFAVRQISVNQDDKGESNANLLIECYALK